MCEIPTISILEVGGLSCITCCKYAASEWVVCRPPHRGEQTRTTSDARLEPTYNRHVANEWMVYVVKLHCQQQTSANMVLPVACDVGLEL